MLINMLKLNMHSLNFYQITVGAVQEGITSDFFMSSALSYQHLILSTKLKVGLHKSYCKTTFIL